MEAHLATTNGLLGVMAAASVIEALVLIWASIGGYLVYRRVVTLLEDTRERVDELEARHVGPTLTRVNAILDDVKIVTATVRGEAERVDQAIRTTMDRVDDTADRFKANVRSKTSRVVGLVRGARVALQTLARA